MSREHLRLPMHGRDHVPGGSDPIPFGLPFAVLWSGGSGSGDATCTLTANQTSNVTFVHYGTSSGDLFTETDSATITVVEAGQYLLVGTAYVLNGVGTDLLPAVPILNLTPGGPYISTYSTLPSGIGVTAWGMAQVAANTGLSFSVENMNVSTSYTAQQRSFYVVRVSPTTV